MEQIMSELIYQVIPATTHGVRDALAQLSVDRDEDFGDDYIATWLKIGDSPETLYKGEDLELGKKLLMQVVEEHEMFVRQAAFSITGVQFSAITPREVTVDLS